MPFFQTLKRFEAAKVLPTREIDWRPVPIPIQKRALFRQIEVGALIFSGLSLMGSGAVVPLLSMTRSAGVITTTAWGWVWIGLLMVVGLVLVLVGLKDVSGNCNEKQCYSETGARISNGLGRRVVAQALKAMDATGQPKYLKKNLALTQIRHHVRRELIASRGYASEWIERDVDEVLADCVTLADLEEKYVKGFAIGHID